AAELLALHHVVSVLDQHLDAGLERVGDLELLAGGDLHLAGALGPDDLDLAVDLADDGLALGDARLEQLLDAGQTLGDVGRRRHATGVERAHRQLGARLADRLGGDHADRLADLDQLAGGQVAAVAVAADALPGLAGEDRADLDVGAAFGDRPRGLVGDLIAGHDDRVALGAGDRLGGDPARDLLDEDVGVDLVGARVPDPDAVAGAAVVLAHDHVLRHVDQAPG